MPEVPSSFWAELGPWGLVSIFVMMIATGLLIPRWMHNQRIADRDRENDLLRQMVDKRDAQVTKLVEQNEVTIRLLEDIKHEANRAAAGRHGTRT